jgi:membrane dipeptidase
MCSRTMSNNGMPPADGTSHHPCILRWRLYSIVGRWLGPGIRQLDYGLMFSRGDDMSIENFPWSRRNFLKAASLLAAFAASAEAQTKITKTKFPFVDGLCLNVLESPDDIRASGLTALISDVSAVEQIQTSDGSPKWQRTFTQTTRSIVETRQKLRNTPNVFLATDGQEINQAFRNGKTAVFLQVQGGGEIVGEDLTRIDLLRELGLRVLQITHHNDNPLGGGSMEKTQTGLTKLGFEAVERMNQLGVIPDLSHASDQTALDTLKTSRKPVVLSHGAARALLNNARCAPDQVIRGIADSGGVMGIFMMSFWLTSDAAPTVESYLKQIRHIIKIGGIEAVGIANDFPLSGEQGLIEAKNNNAEAVKNYLPWWDSIAKLGVLGFDKRPTHVAIPELNNLHRVQTIFQSLEKSGFTSKEVEKIMGGNWIRVLSEDTGGKKAQA